MKIYIVSTIALLAAVATAAEDIPERRLKSYEECDYGWVGDWGPGLKYCCCESDKDDCDGKSDWKGDGNESCDSCSKRCEPDDSDDDCYACTGMEGKWWGPYWRKDGKCEKKWCDKDDSCIHTKVISDDSCEDEKKDDSSSSDDCDDKKEDCCDCCDDRCDDEDSKSDFQRCVKKKCKSKCKKAAKCHYGKKSKYRKFAVKKCR
mmetsp:Transcript_5615/g.15771  ORF Transcript_5615/g.15771 Transcript_5615/m.15771 type:complete len:204 (-) Transcript_5615:195-806(-)